jgi:hypothetical protein
MTKFLGDFWRDFRTEIIWSAITLTITILAGVVRKLGIYLRNRRPYLQFWQPGTNHHFYIVPGSITYGQNQRVSSMSTGDIGALVELTASIRTLYPAARVERLISTDFPAERLASTIVTIGGPKNNQITRELLAETDIGYSFDGTTLKSTYSGQAYTPEYDDQGHPKIDYGLLLRAGNPYDNSEWFYAFAGCHTYGCLAAARFVSVFDAHALDHLRTFRRRTSSRSDVAGIIRARVVNNSVTSIMLIEASGFGDVSLIRRTWQTLTSAQYHPSPSTHWSLDH